MIELRAGDATALVSPLDGGRVAGLEVGEFALLVTDDAGPLSWGSYPMVPWAGRLGQGTFTFEGRTVQMPLDLGDHAIHGTGYTSVWHVLDQGPDFVELETELRWPFGGRAHQHVQLFDDRLVCLLAAIADGEAMPAVVGWHPWFVWPRSTDLHFDRMLRRGPDGLPDGTLVDQPPGPWDDCFVGAHRPLQLHHEHLTVTIDSDCDHWVVYDEQARGMCVEPQSGPPNAFNTGAAATLRPGEMHQRQMTIRWQPRA